ncbi:proton-conducting transporter membrane subunit, partial [Campylobacter concisus]|uniref:proton-conducting transporter transmembrane domain-containing protein n=1 Tax=Campylobacter concisus TaxID=199 RepID=UPI0023DDB98E
FIASAIGFKLSLIPFNTWIPAVYAGSNAPLAAYMSIVPKVAAPIVALRIFAMLEGSQIWWIKAIVYIIAVLTMSLSNIMALVQQNAKRMPSFSSIPHACVVPCPLVANSHQANVASFFYWIMFLFANFCAFSMFWVASCDVVVLVHLRFKLPYEQFLGPLTIFPR